MGRRVLAGCLFFSGAASLVMEVAWSRALSLVLGNSHQAVATVVASMMTGLFLGSLFAARLLPRIRQLPKTYGMLEMGIGLYGALTPLVFALLGLVLGPLYLLPSGAFLFLRFLVVFIVLLPPSAGMGATLPIVTAALSQNASGKPGESGSVGGWLYGLNTVGAFIGTLAGGFLLLPGLGLLKATLAGAGTSMAVGAAVWLMSSSLLRQERGETKVAVNAKAAEGFPLVLPLYAASGFVAMVYEITWTRVMAPVAGSSVYSFTLILAAILAGIGVGSMVLSTRVGRWIHPGHGFVAGQILLGTVAFGSMWGLKLFPKMMLSVAARYPSDPQAFLLREFLAFGAIVLAPAIILGALFPFASRLLRTLETEAGADVGRVYAWNTAGSLFGSLAAGFFLVETLGSQRTLAMACLASLCLGVAGLILAPGRIFRPIAGLSAATLALLIPLLTPSWDLYMMTTGVTQLLRNIRRMGQYATVEEILAFAAAPDVHILFHQEGKTSTVTVVREWVDKWLRVDGKTDASTARNDMLTQSLLGQLPFFFARNPQSVAVIGFGSGVTAHSVLTHPVKLVETIEIEEQVVKAATLFFEEVNGKPLSDPRHRLIVDDARTALAYRPQTYDIIISEPSNPWMAGVNNLFTTEFYSLVKKRLTPGGILCQWVQSYELSDESLQVLLHTAASSFPYLQLFGSYLGSDMLLLASEQPISLAPEAAAFFPDRPEVIKDLARVGINNLADLALLYTSTIGRAPRGALLNNDDNSLIQYRAPLELLRGIEPQRKFLRGSKEDLMQLLYPGVDEKTVLLAVGTAAYGRQALPTLQYLVGRLQEMGESEAAGQLSGLADALAIQLQRSSIVQQSLVAAEARVAVHDNQGALAALADAEAAGFVSSEEWARAGMVLLSAGRYAEAEQALDQAVSLADPRFLYQSLAARGSSRYRLGRYEEGKSDIDAAKQLDPDGAVAYLLYALALHGVGEREAAIEELQAGMKVAPEDMRLGTYLHSYLKESPAAKPAVPAAPATP